MDGQEWTDAIRYRIAYGQAAAWAETQRFDHNWGARIHPSRHARCRIGAVDETTLETIREAVADALAGRRP
jgi:hypothetical protein